MQPLTQFRQVAYIQTEGKKRVAEGPFNEKILDLSASDIMFSSVKQKEIMYIPGYKELDYKHDAIDELLREVLEQQVRYIQGSWTERSYRFIPERSTYSRMAW